MVVEESNECAEVSASAAMFGNEEEVMGANADVDVDADADVTVREARTRWSLGMGVGSARLFRSVPGDIATATGVERLARSTWADT